jgi:predicted permease
LPVLASIFGQSGVFYGSIYVVTFNLLVWTLGVIIFTGKADRATVKQGITNPALIAVAIGLFLFLFSLKLPLPIYRCIEIAGGMTTPLAMMVIGSMLADIRWSELFSGFSIYYVSLVRLIVVPLLAAFFLKTVGVRQELVQICTAAAAMPAAAVTAILAEKYQSDTQLTSRIIFISTALSIVTIPFVLMVIR